MKRSLMVKAGLFLVITGFIASCQKDVSKSTGWEYNKMENGGFEKGDKREQETGPGLVMIEGGTFTMGQTEEDVMADHNNMPNRVSVRTFYIDQTEVTNFFWLEYVYWMKRVYNKTYPHIYKKSLPDTLAWRDPMSYREDLVSAYLRYPAYRDYPVVGVSWNQANDFCKWRTDRVNEFILVREGIIEWHFNDDLAANDSETPNNLDPETKKEYSKRKTLQNAPENMFSTESYLAGQYTVESGKAIQEKDKNNKNVNKKDKNGNDMYPYLMTDGTENTTKVPRDPYQIDDFDPINAKGNASQGYYRGKRLVRMEDGFLLPDYRLPTEAEWEFAALGLIGNLDPNSENIKERKIYPWNGFYVRKDQEQFEGTIQANFVRGRGDAMGVAGAGNDAAVITTEVTDYWPNDYGLYNMAGNVSEWVLDTYRPTTSEVVGEFMPFRGNLYKTKLMVPNGMHDEYVKSKSNIYDVYGMKEYVNEYARVLYLAATGVALDVNSKFLNNWDQQKTQNKYTKKGNVNFEVKGSADAKQSGENWAVLVGDTVSLSVTEFDNYLKYLEAKNPKITASDTIPNWTLPGNVKLLIGKKTDKTITVEVLANGPVDVSFKMGKEPIIEKKGIITGVMSKLDFNEFVNTQSGNARIMADQAKRKYQFNTPSAGYIANNRVFSASDSARFQMLDDINAYLDTAIMLYNKSYTIKASSLVEMALYGNINTLVTTADIRPATSINDDVQKEILFEIITSPADPNDPTSETEYGYSSIFSKEYLEYRLKNFSTDPTVATWIMNLRDGLSEYTVESRGKQRWRNVTEEENIGRLNYRKDDYVDYLDGDLESSIFYDNKTRKDQINNGSRSAKNTVYQSQQENYDLNGNLITDNSSGWGKTLISDKSKVYKGGSWMDRTYWLSPGNRRFLDQDKSSALIGFRCAMDHFGRSRNENYKKPRK